MNFDNGTYFFHVSFLKEVSDTWLDKDETGKSAEIFMSLVFKTTNDIVLDSCDRTIKELSTCDRTMGEMAKTKYSLTQVPGFMDLINEKFLPNCDSLEYDEYCLKVASFKRISAHPTFFVVSDEEKTKLVGIAQGKGYTLNIISPEDFD